MQHTGDTTHPDEHRGPSSRPPRGVAAAVAAALLAGGAVAWATRSPDAPAVGADRSLVISSSSAAPTPAPTATPPGSTPVTTSTGLRADRSARAGQGPAVVVRPATPPPAVAASAPDRVTIGRLGVDMPVVPVGVAKDGEMALPRSPAEMGWYRYGPRPGDPAGATVLAAHLDMPGYGTGPIAVVDELRKGDVLSVRSGGTTRRYSVTAVTSVLKTTLDLSALFARDGPARLHVVTCGGSFDRELRRYDRNIVVTAEPIV